MYEISLKPDVKKIGRLGFYTRLYLDYCKIWVNIFFKKNCNTMLPFGKIHHVLTIVQLPITQ